MSEVFNADVLDAINRALSAENVVTREGEEPVYCNVNNETREIEIPGEITIFGVEHDENAVRVFFKCPKIIGDNVDIDITRSMVYIIYINAGGEKDQYIVTDVNETEDDNVTFSWLINRKPAKYQGITQFGIRVIKSKTGGEIENEWNTTVANANILNGVETEDIELSGDNIDVVNQLLDLTKHEIELTKQNLLEEIEQKGQETLASIPDDYTQLQADVDIFEGEIISAVNYTLQNIGGDFEEYREDNYALPDEVPKTAQPQYYWGFYEADENCILSDILFVGFAKIDSTDVRPELYTLNIFEVKESNYVLKNSVFSNKVTKIKDSDSGFNAYYGIHFPLIGLKKGELIAINKNTEGLEVQTNNSIIYNLTEEESQIIAIPNDVGSTIPISSTKNPKVVLDCVFNVFKQTFIIPEPVVPVNHYVVVSKDGTGDYESVVEAVEKEPEKTPIIIMPGIYEGTVQAFTKEIILIGVDRNTCILKSKDGRYEYPCINGSCGYLENLTLYSQYESGISNEIGSESASYAFHCEHAYGAGKTLEFHHCTLISDFFPALGMGMRKDFTCILDDVILENRQISGRGNYTEKGTLGALYFHDSNGEVGNSILICKNCILKSKLKNVMCPYTLKREGNNVTCTFTNNVLYSESNKYNENIWWRNGNPFEEGSFELEIGYGNSNSDINNIV